MMATTGDALLKRVLETGDDALASKLLALFQSGLAIARLREVLRHPNPKVRRIGVFVAAELRTGAKPLLRDLEPLLRDDDFRSRYQVLDCILVCAGPKEGDVIAGGLGLIADRELAVSKKAIGFAGRLGKEQLEAALPFLKDPALRASAQWLSETVEPTTRGLAEKLTNSPAITRRFAAAAAGRPRNLNKEILRLALASTDPAISSFAESELRIAGDLPARGPGGLSATSARGKRARKK